MTLTELAQIAQSLSIIFASLFAIYGFDAWRREHIGKRRIELAEETLALFYQAKDAIESIRSSFGFEGEGATRVPGSNEKPEHKAALDQAYVLIERYNRHTELFSRIRSLRYRVMAQLGSEAAQPFDALNRVVNELLLSSHRMARLNTQRERLHETHDAQEKRHREYLDVMNIYYSGAEDDPISPKVQQILEDIERTCRKIIESKGTLYAAINAKLLGSG